MEEFIYVIREREFLKTNEFIYKIGRSKQRACKRLNDYPNGSLLECDFRVDNCIEKEKEIIRVLTDKYIRRLDIGYEYFEGNRNEILKDIFNICINLDYKNEKFEITNETSEIKKNNKILKTQNSEEQKKINLLKEKEKTVERKLKLEKTKKIIETSINLKIQKIDKIKQNEILENDMKIKLINILNNNLEKGDFSKEEKGKKTFFIKFNTLREIIIKNNCFKKIKLKELKDYIEKETNEIFENIKKINGITYRNVLLNYRKCCNEKEYSSSSED